MPNLSHILSSTFPLSAGMPTLGPDDQAGNIVLEANEPAPDREFIPQNGIKFTQPRPRIPHHL